jgi:hypothetical protein
VGTSISEEALSENGLLSNRLHAGEIGRGYADVDDDARVVVSLGLC